MSSLYMLDVSLPSQGNVHPVTGEPHLCYSLHLSLQYKKKAWNTVDHKYMFKNNKSLIGDASEQVMLYNLLWVVYFFPGIELLYRMDGEWGMDFRP